MWVDMFTEMLIMEYREKNSFPKKIKKRFKELKKDFRRNKRNEVCSESKTGLYRR
jgi:phosphopantothenoylcysteine synthetase/decarboxylase